MDLVYFAKYGSERSVNARHVFEVEALLRRLRPYATLRLTNTRERPGFEIDARSRRRETGVAFGNDFQLTAKTTAEVEMRHNRIAFDADALFDGTYLFQVLNRTESAVTAGVRHALTPLTTVVAGVDVERNRFAHSTHRDTNAVRVMGGVELARSALVSGAASVGFRSARPLDAATPPFDGAVGSADVSYELLGATRFTLRVARDLDHSYDERWPYYVASGVSGTIRRQVAASWDAQVSVGRQGLAYRASTLFPAGDRRRDRVRTFGVGAGYRLGPTSRLVFNVDHVARTSELPLHGYSGLQSGFSLSYDF
jgi:hypothetical protein